MLTYPRLILILIVLQFAANCKRAPEYQNTSRSGDRSGIGLPSKSDDENVAMNPASVGMAPGKENGEDSYDATVGGADMNLTRKTLNHIMQAPGGEQDALCAGKKFKSKTQLRLLTRDEYQNTVTDILQVAKDYRSTLPTASIVFGFSNNADNALVSDDHASAYLDAAIAIAVESKGRLKALVGCEESAGLSCAQSVVEKLAPLLWRRPLENNETASLIDLYKSGLAASASDGMTLLISGLLTSPDFLYRTEIGKEKALNAYEVASAISYFFWGSSPDAKLREAAASGSLLQEDVLVSESQRLFADKRSKFATSDFAKAWLDSEAILGDDKDAKEFPDFNDTIKAAMAAEAADSFDHFVKLPNSSFDMLFNSDYTIGSAKLATYYKGESSSEGGLNKIRFTGTPRKGLLGLGAILAHNASPAETHPIMRGNFVLEKIFCSIPLPTPPGLDVKVPDFAPGLTTRERFAVHTQNPDCSICHKRIDGIGFGMEDFDGAGQYRDKDNGKKVDDAGEIVAIGGEDSFKFNGVGELSQFVAKSSQAKRCYVVEWYRFAHGYAERPSDVCAIRDIANKFEKGTMTLSQLLLEIVTHPSFVKKD